MKINRDVAWRWFLSRKWYVLIFISLFFIGGCFFYARNKQQYGVITLYGNVDVRQVDLGFRVFGRVQTLYHEEGDWVRPGDLLARLEERPYTDRYQEARARVASIRAQLDNELKMRERRRVLVDSKSVSQEDLESVSAQCAVLQENLKQALAAERIAEKDMQDTSIYAPTTGFVLTRIREPGTIVNPQEPVYTISVASPVWVRAFISAPLLGKVYSGMPVEIYTDTPGSKVYTGQVGFISPVSEFTPKTVETAELRTDLVYRIRAYVDNSDFGLRQGMPVTLKLRVAP